MNHDSIRKKVEEEAESLFDSLDSVYGEAINSVQHKDINKIADVLEPLYRKIEELRKVMLSRGDEISILTARVKDLESKLAKAVRDLLLKINDNEIEER